MLWEASERMCKMVAAADNVPESVTSRSRNEYIKLFFSDEQRKILRWCAFLGHGVTGVFDEEAVSKTIQIWMKQNWSLIKAFDVLLFELDLLVFVGMFNTLLLGAEMIQI